MKFRKYKKVTIQKLFKMREEISNKRIKIHNYNLNNLSGNFYNINKYVSLIKKERFIVQEITLRYMLSRV